MTRVGDVMDADVVTLRGDTPIRVAAAVLDSRNGQVAVVVDDSGAPIGVVSRPNLRTWRELPDGWQIELDPEAVVAAVMTHSAAVAAPGDDVADVVAEMAARGITAMAVFTGSRAVGILTSDDARECRNREAHPSTSLA